jgi:autotransporter translocation and assembly factor TamB
MAGTRTPPHVRTRARRALATVARAAALGAVFTLAAAGALVSQLNQPPLRRFAMARVNRSLASSFKGTVVIERIGSLHLTTIGGVDAEVRDPEGQPVLHVRGARLRLGTYALVRSLLRGGPLDVRVPEVVLDDAEVVVEEDAAGAIGLARALAPRQVSTQPPADVRVTVPAIHLRHAWVHGHLAAVPIVDADLVDLDAAFASTRESTDVEVKRLLVRSRGLPGLSPEGEVRARATLPADAAAERRLRFHYEGRVGDLPVRAEGSLDGEDVVARVDVTEARPAAVEALAPGQLQLGAAVSAHVEVEGRLPVLRPRLEATLGAGRLTASGLVTLPEGPRPALRATAHVGVKDLDLSLLQRGAPPSRLGAELDADVVSRPGGDLSGTFRLESPEGEVKGQVVPPLRVQGEVDPRRVKGTAAIAERGAPTRVGFALEPRADGAALDQLTFAVDTTIPRLDDLARLGPLGHGRAHVEASGHLDLATKQLSARARGDLAGLAIRGLALQRGTVEGAAEGPLDALRFTTVARGRGLRAGGYAFPEASLRAGGSAAGMDLSAQLQGDGRSPSVRAHVEARVRGLSGRGGAGHPSTAVHGELSASLGNAGHLDLRATDLQLGGAATDAEAWKHATGSVTLSGAVDLARLMETLPEDQRPLERAGGTITLEGEATRPATGAAPELDLQATTAGLVLAGKRERTRSPDGSLTLGPAPFRTEGLDGRLRVRLEAASGEARVALEVHDRHGALASLDAATKLPLPRLLQRPDAAPALVREAPLEARITVPRRSLDALPPALGKLPVRGEVELVATLAGTMLAPRLALTARGSNLVLRDAASCPQPTEVETTLAYDGRVADVHLAASREGHAIVAADGVVAVSATEALAGGALPWEASGRATLSGFPLAPIGALTRRPLAGSVSGQVAVTDLHRAAHLEASLDLRDLALDRTRFPRGQVRVTVKDGALAAAARLDQADGFAATTVQGAVAWGPALAPALDLTRPVDVTLQARGFRANAAAPFTQGIFSELDGRIDADAALHVAPGGKDGEVRGSVALRDGVFELPQMGERFRGVRGRVIMKPWGTLRFEDFAAEASTGQLTASGEAVLKGLELQRASARIRIPRGESIPLAVEGVSMGRAQGEITARAVLSDDGQRLDLHVDIPTLHVDLPQTIGHSVQPLQPDPTVRVGRSAGRDFLTLPLGAPTTPRAPSALVLHAAIRLGNDVQVRRDTTLRLVVEGEPRIEVGEETRVSGRIRVTRGQIELQGKQFIVDRGEVSFVGADPADPFVVAGAHWDAPDATRVFADFSGHVSSGKLTLRSEPELTQEEIVSLLLFGSTTGSFGAQAPPGREESTGVWAAGLAGGLITQGLNRALSGLTSADISTRVDTSDWNSPRPELAVQLSRKVSARLSYKLGVPAPGDNPDRTELTLDWRFLRDWSLTAVVGDQGSTALDLVWRHRY